MSQRKHIVTFHVTCPALRVWVVLTNDKIEPRVIEMHQRFPRDWAISEDLSPGEYRCRYYGGDEHMIVYLGPARVEGSTDCGLDALVSVKATARSEAKSDPREDPARPHSSAPAES